MATIRKQTVATKPVSLGSATKQTSVVALSTKKLQVTDIFGKKPSSPLRSNKITASPTATKAASKAVATKMAGTKVSSASTGVEKSAAVTAVQSSIVKSNSSVAAKLAAGQPVVIKSAPADSTTLSKDSASKVVRKLSICSTATPLPTKVTPTSAAAKPSTAAAKGAAPSANCEAKSAATSAAKSTAAAKTSSACKIVSTGLKSSKLLKPLSKSTAGDVSEKLSLSETKATGAHPPPAPKPQPVSGKTVVATKAPALVAKRAAAVSSPKTAEARNAAAPTKKPSAAANATPRTCVTPVATKPRSVRTPVASKSVSKVSAGVRICDADSTNVTTADRVSDVETNAAAAVVVGCDAAPAATATPPESVSNFTEDQAYKVAERMVQVLGMAAVAGNVDEPNALLKASVVIDMSAFESNEERVSAAGGAVAARPAEANGRAAAEAADAEPPEAGSGGDVSAATGSGARPATASPSNGNESVAENVGADAGVAQSGAACAANSTERDSAAEEMNENCTRTRTQTDIIIEKDTEVNQSTDENEMPEVEQQENLNEISNEEEDQAISDEPNLEEVYSSETEFDLAENQLNVCQNTEVIENVAEKSAALDEINGENVSTEVEEILADQNSYGEETGLVELEVCSGQSVEEIEIASTDAELVHDNNNSQISEDVLQQGVIREPVNSIEIEDVNKIEMEENYFENDTAAADSECSDDPNYIEGFEVIEFDEENMSRSLNQTESCLLSIHEVSVAEVENIAVDTESIASADRASLVNVVEKSFNNATETINDFDEEDTEKIIPEFIESSSFVVECADEETSGMHVTNAECIPPVAVVNEEKCTHANEDLSLEVQFVELDENVPCECDKILAELVDKARNELDANAEQHQIIDEEFEKVQKKRNKRRNKRNKKLFKTFKNENTDDKPLGQIQESYTDENQSSDKRPNLRRSKYSKKKQYRRFSEPFIQSPTYVAHVRRSLYHEYY